jgi:O-antigen/teichoic acid export membrane protein
MKSRKSLFIMLTGLLAQLMNIVVNLIVVKLFLETYGSEVNGLNSTILKLMAYLSIVEAGVGAASIQALYRPLIEKNWEKVNGILAATRKFYLLSGFIFFILALASTFIFPLVVHTTLSYSFVSIYISITATRFLMEYLIQGKYRVLLTADQREYIINNIYTATVIVSGILRIILIYLNVNVLIVESINTGLFILRAVAIKIYVNRKYSKVSYFSQPDKEAISKRWDAMTHQIAGLLVNNTDILLLSIFIGFMQASVYNLYSMICVYATVPITILIQSFAAGIGQTLAGSGNIREVNQLCEYISFIFITVFMSILFILFLPFVEMYTTNVQDIDYINPILFYLMFISMVIKIIRTPGIIVINGAGHFAETRNRAIFEAILNVCISLILLKFIGVYGIPLGAIISNLYRTTDIIIYSHKYILKYSVINTVRRLVYNFIISVIVISVVNNLIEIKVNNLYTFLIEAIFITIVMAILVILANVLIELQSAMLIWKRVNSIFKVNKILKRG